MQLETPTRSGYTLTSADQRHAAELSTRGARELKVSRRLCRWIRRSRHRGFTTAEIASTIDSSTLPTVSRVAVRMHAVGECGHQTRVPAAELGGRVTWVRCRAFRAARSRGTELATIVERSPVDVSRTTVGDHCRGDCSHPETAPTHARETVTLEQCEAWRQAAADGATASGVASEKPWTRKCVHAHIRGDCAHDPTVGRARCNQWRTAVKDGDAPADLAAAESVPKITVREHITGACEHGFESSVMPVRHNGAEWTSTAVQTAEKSTGDPSRRGATFE